MRFYVFVALVLAVAATLTQWYQRTSHICPIPVTYRLGEIDESFTLNRADAFAAIEAATDTWESVVPYDLFQYDEQADITVNFQFDDRQARADAQAEDAAKLDSAAAQNEAMRRSIEELTATYDTMRASFVARSDAYSADLQAYNDQVQRVNDRGGADGPLFAELAATQQALGVEAESLRTMQAELQRIGVEINRLSAEGNRLIEAYNQDVVQFNDRYGDGEVFTQGDYQGDEINIYKFSNQAELVSVLAHEFGHALGIGHVETTGSLMYYLLEEGLEAPVQVGEADIQAFENTCQFDSFEFRLRQFIRSVVS